MITLHPETTTRSGLRAAGMPVLLVLLLAPVPGVAQESPDVAWWAVTALQPSERLRVELQTGLSIAGQVESVSMTHLTVARGAGTLGVARDEVRQVELMTGPPSGRSTAIGAGVGAATGAAVGFGAFGCQPRSLFCIKRSEAVPVTAAIGAGLGAIIGYTMARERQRRTVLYTAPTP